MQISPLKTPWMIPFSLAYIEESKLAINTEIQPISVVMVGIMPLGNELVFSKIRAIAASSATLTPVMIPADNNIAFIFFIKIDLASPVWNIL